MPLAQRETQQHTLTQQVNRNRRLSTSALILSGNVSIGDQVSSLFHDVGCQTQVIHNDKHAYDLLHRVEVDSIVVDIDTLEVNGLSFLVWCKLNRPSIAIYVICSGGNTKSMRVARNLGCKGYFYLGQGKALVENRYGMARDITLL